MLWWARAQESGAPIARFSEGEIRGAPDRLRPLCQGIATDWE